MTQRAIEATVAGVRTRPHAIKRFEGLGGAKRELVKVFDRHEGEPMKQKQLAGLAVFLVGVTGGAAFAHDHLPPVNCSQYPWWCRGYCAELNACRAGNTPIGGSDCLTEENNLAFCELRAPFVLPVVVPPPFVPPVVVAPPPACPAGQHFAQGECQADHVCGDDEIGGGETPCEPCGNGRVPNQRKTVCIPCPHGESSEFPGRCEPACWHTATDTVAKEALLGVPAEPKERGASVYCFNETVYIASWAMSTPDNACQVAYANRYAGPSCWGGGSKTNGCNLSRAHTHPFFSYPRDEEVTCHDRKINSKERARSFNRSGRNFSPADRANATAADVLGHLGLPPDEPPEGAPIPTDRDTVKALRRTGRVEEI